MDYHNKKITERLSPSKKNEVMDRYLTLKNKLGLNFFKPEIEGIKQEKEDQQLIIKDQKRKIIYDTEEISILRLQNNEYRRNIGEIKKDMAEVHNKRLKTEQQLDQAYDNLFNTNESAKLYNNTISDLKCAKVTEESFLKTLKE